MSAWMERGHPMMGGRRSGEGESACGGCWSLGSRATWEDQSTVRGDCNGDGRKIRLRGGWHRDSRLPMKMVADGRGCRWKGRWWIDGLRESQAWSEMNKEGFVGLMDGTEHGGKGILVDLEVVGGGEVERRAGGGDGDGDERRSSWPVVMVGRRVRLEVTMVEVRVEVGLVRSQRRRNREGRVWEFV